VFAGARRKQHRRVKESVAGGAFAAALALALRLVLATSGELSALASNVGPAPS
jgi:hypothetical protein